MKDHDPVFESIAVLNPVPREDELPAAASSPAALLARIDGRDQMTTTKTKTTTPAPTPPTRRRGLLVAAAAFIAVLIIGGGIALFSGPDPTPPETTLTPSTTEATTTSSSSTTSSSTTPTPPVPATVDPAVGEAFMAAFLSFDLAQLEALPWDGEADESVVGTQDFWQSLNYTVLEGPTCTPFTRTVECTVLVQDDFTRVLVGEPVLDTYSIQLSSDGTTIRFVQIDAADTEVTLAFLGWVPENSPELFTEGSVCAAGIGEPACMAAHIALLDDYVLTDEYQEQFGAGS